MSTVNKRITILNRNTKIWDNFYIHMKNKMTKVFPQQSEQLITKFQLSLSVNLLLISLNVKVI